MKPDQEHHNPNNCKQSYWLKQIIILALILLLCLPAAGCYDSVEIDQQVYALVIGVDKGVNNKIRVTFQYPTYKEGGGGGGMGQDGGGAGGEASGEVDGTVVSTVEAPSLIEGINTLNSASNRQISLSHTKMLVFSEEYARAGVARYVEPLARFREVRELMRVVVCRGRAEDFIRANKTSIGQNIAKNIELTYLQSQNTGYFRDVFFTEFYTDLMTPYGQPTAIYAGVNDFKQLEEAKSGQEPSLQPVLDILPGRIPRKGGGQLEFFGTAVFDGDKMVGTLSQNETRFFLMGIGEFERGFFTLEDKNKPGYVYVLEVEEGQKPRIKARLENGVPIIDFNLSLEVDIASIQSRIDYERLDKIEELENHVKAYFEEGMKKTIEKTQQEWNADIFHFGRKVAGQFRTIQELKEYNWLSHYKEARINVAVETNIRRSGYFFETNPILSTKSEQEEE